MTNLLHPITYWSPGSTSPQALLGLVALKATSPRDGLPSAGASKAYIRNDVFRVGGIVAAGSFGAIPTTAREVMQVDPRKSRRGKRTLYEATLSDGSAEHLFDAMVVYRSIRQSDGMGGFVNEPVLIGTYPCELTFTPSEGVFARHERGDGAYTLVALKDSGLRYSDTVYITSRSVYLTVTGAVDNPPHGLYLMAPLGVSDEQNPDDLQL